MPALYHWYLEASCGCVMAHGNVTGHPKLDNGLFIHTSPVKAVEDADGVLRLATHSGSLYTLPPEQIDPKLREETEKCLKTFGIDPGFVEGCVQARLQADAQRREEAERTLTPGQLLLEAAGNTVFRAFFRTEEELLPVKPTVHIGMFQDSVLITDWEGGKVDFRYFPEKDRLRPYHISDGLTEIVIHNLGNTDVAFGQEKTAQLCRAGEVTVLRAGDHENEWLFSPDAVNGKCLFKERENKTDDVE